MMDRRTEEHFKRRYATRLGFRGGPWAKAHGYPQMPLCAIVATRRG